MKLKIILESKDQGRFRAYVPALPTCTGTGIGKNEALENIRKAVLLHFGIEEIVHPQKQHPVAYYKYRLTQAITGKMSTEKKQAALTALAGIGLMVAVIWGAGFFA